MVEKVDEAAKAVVVKGKKDEKTFVVDDKTKITKGGKDMPFADLKKGMNVSVEYKKDGDKMVATAIKASAPKAAKADERRRKRLLRQQKRKRNLLKNQPKHPRSNAKKILKKKAHPGRGRAFLFCIHSNRPDPILSPPLDPLILLVLPQ